MSYKYLINIVLEEDIHAQHKKKSVIILNLILYSSFSLICSIPGEKKRVYFVNRAAYAERF